MKSHKALFFVSLIALSALSLPFSGQAQMYSTDPYFYNYPYQYQYSYNPYQSGPYYSPNYANYTNYAYDYNYMPLTTYTNINPDIFRQAIGPYRWTSNYPTFYTTTNNSYQNCTCPVGYFCQNACSQEVAQYVTGYPNQIFFYTY